MPMHGAGGCLQHIVAKHKRKGRQDCGKRVIGRDAPSGDVVTSRPCRWRELGGKSNGETLRRDCSLDV
jgi:hypothetical protein